jgi:electron transfer flavoprotein alpha subunit
MANIVTYIEVRDGAPTPPSLFAMAEARRIAAAVGATVYGVLALPPLSNVKIDELAAEVSLAGADRVIAFSHPDFAGPTLDVTHGHILLHVAQRLLSPLCLLPAGTVALEIGPLLSIRLGGTFLLGAAIQLREDSPPSVCLRRLLPDGSVRTIDIKEYERPLVASLGAGTYDLPAGGSFAEVEIVASPPPKGTPFAVLSVIKGQHANGDLATNLVVLHPSVPEGHRERIMALAGAQTLVVEEEDPPNALLAKASPDSIVWIRPGGNFPSAPFPALRPDTRAYFLGRGDVPSGSPFTVIPCESAEQLATLLEAP